MTTEKTLSEQITSTPAGMREWQLERAIFEITERVCELMQENGINRAQLAQRLGTTKGHVTQLLGGRANMTIRTVSDLFLALGREFRPADAPITVENDTGPSQFFSFEQASHDRKSHVVSCKHSVAYHG